MHAVTLNSSCLWHCLLLIHKSPCFKKKHRVLSSVTRLPHLAPSPDIFAVPGSRGLYIASLLQVTLKRCTSIFALPRDPHPSSGVLSALCSREYNPSRQSPINNFDNEDECSNSLPSANLALKMLLKISARGAFPTCTLRIPSTTVEKWGGRRFYFLHPPRPVV